MEKAEFMNTLTIPRKLVQNDDLVVVPRREYERLFRFWAAAELLTASQKKAINKGVREIARGKFFTSKQVKHELGL
ncbi:MAG: hypothetical protein A3G49_01555 [Candidatus Sungbacteria bacterium RIFCSPLOWO2_12_FULL_41_11]|uniref:Uncharacterized protein n=1 Tax=Candidatus Sungbacteria bacterium RIFCSPLOWO2_12_FULL_41_11 TaxID=1802286 RepID=A0A1G2LQI8_9BACT|nr:MAG: hypothetical protein A3D41_04310 [Candidatus Sungbacteria bacterium RIFCSPHIGHO2_02_FULL_41_12b]OHA13908.1 MAG: hypothetical protein A3G49_01555 [Candidatus Sungbacteria bacterium RIFCSPLOWO2_12_FULL_41_11]